MTSCGGAVRENTTYFVNPNHPDTTDGTGSCQLTVLKIHPDICQIRWHRMQKKRNQCAKKANDF
jgi:hypothetical protein